MVSGRIAFVILLSLQACAQIPRMPERPDPLTIVRPADLHKPFTVAGPTGALLGERSGTFEAWIWPVKVLSHFSIEANLQDYPVPIELAPLAATIAVTPAVTTITYSHAAFTVRQKMFAPSGGDAGAVVLFEIDSVRPLTLTFRFEPEMQRMWPAPSAGRPSAQWTRGGYYMLHTDDLDFSAAIDMPRAQPGILAPYQERPQSHPLELRLAFDPKNDVGVAFPLLMLVGDRNTDFEHRLTALRASLPRIYAENQNFWAHFFDTRLTSETPDAQLDQAMRWAEVAIEQGRVRFHQETGLIAGYYESGDSARPGYAWFFGRDSLWSSYAINGYGDFGLTRDVLQFLMERQRADGKIMHEFSQTADLVKWKSFPYFYAAADSTPLFVMAMADYVETSGDVAFLREHWDAVRRAYQFTRAHDSDGDGIYENSEGTGWVESWPAGMPHQEIYLAALDEQSAGAMAAMAELAGEDGLAASARAQAEKIRAKIEAEYDADHFYAFSRNADGTLDHTATIYPAVAWWDGTFALAHPEAMLDRWASSEFSTDWGTRDLSAATPFYDPISYHQGSVWPLFTGWVSLAEYRAGRTLAGYAHLMQNAGLTWTQDLGAVTELLSGEFFQPLGRSSSHQIWSSAMVVTPALRGLFGLGWDAPHRKLHLAPNLPASWDSARLKNVPLGDARVTLEFRRDSGRLTIRANSTAPVSICNQTCDAHEISIPLPPVEVEMPHGLPLPGSRTVQIKAVGERRAARSYQIDFEAPAGSEYDLPVRLNQAQVSVSGAEISQSRLHIRFTATRQSVRFSW